MVKVTKANKKNEEVINAFNQGKDVLRFCFTNFEKKEIWSKVIASSFEDDSSQYKVA